MTDFASLFDAAYKSERIKARRLAQRAGLSHEEALHITLTDSADPLTLAALLQQRAALVRAAQERIALRTRDKAAALAQKRAKHDGPATAWRAWFDGSAHPNPGRCGIGALLKGPGGELVEIARDGGHGNSSEAEYMALIAVLETARDHDARGLTIYGDSRVVIDDLNGPPSKAAPSLRQYREAAQALMVQLGEVAVRWIPRAKNAEADALSQRARSS